MKKALGLLTLLVLMVTLLASGAQATAQGTAWDQLLAETLRSVEDLSNPAPTLTVSGSSSITVVPDVSIVNVGVTVQSPTVREAQDSVNETMNTILAALRALGIPEENMATSNYSVYPVYDYDENGQQTLRGYQVTDQVNVTVTDFTLINQVLDTAVENGANEINGLSFQVADESAYYQQALVEAVGQAQTKALALAAATGRTLGGLVSLTEEAPGFVAYAAKSVATDAGTGTNIQAGQTEISATVTLVFELVSASPAG